MAQLVPNLYDLSNTGPRRQGQRRENNSPSLHGHRFNGRNLKAKNVGISEEIEKNISAPPQDSSDEKEAPVFEAEGYGEASDDSEFDNVTVGKPRSTRPDPIFHKENLKTGRPLDAHALNDKDSQERHLHLSSQKRKAEYSSDNEAIVNMSFQMSQSKKYRKSAGYGKAKAAPRNIHKAPASKGEKEFMGKRSALAAKEGKSDFIKPPTDDLLAECKP